MKANVWGFNLMSFILNFKDLDIRIELCISDLLPTYFNLLLYEHILNALSNN